MLIQDLNAINLDKLLSDNIDGDDGEDIDDNELEKELANLSADEDSYSNQKSVPTDNRKEIKVVNQSNSKLKYLEQNLNSFNKKYNDALKENNASKSKRLKRIVDVSKTLQIKINFY